MRSTPSSPYAPGLSPCFPSLTPPPFPYCGGVQRAPPVRDSVRVGGGKRARRCRPTRAARRRRPARKAGRPGKPRRLGPGSPTPRSWLVGSGRGPLPTPAADQAAECDSERRERERERGSRARRGSGTTPSPRPHPPASPSLEHGIGPEDPIQSHTCVPP